MPDGETRLWSSAEAYEQYVGRWSRPVANEFVRWLDADRGLDWLDVGCGTGALTEVIVAADPAVALGIDMSPVFVASATASFGGRATFAVGSAQALPVAGDALDVVVSGLMLNFVPDPLDAVREFARVLRPRGVAAVYLWDYGDRMQMMRYLWDAASALDPAARKLDEGARCAICTPAALEALFLSAGFEGVETRAIDVPTVFVDFDDYWRPFLAGRTPAPAYVMSLGEAQREALREEVRRRLPVERDGSVRLIARALAVRGRAP